MHLLDLFEGPFSAGLTHSTVSTVCPPPLLRCLVYLDVRNGQVGGIETLEVGVGLSILQKVQEECGRLDGPAGTGDTKLLA